jgi:hypothetical protein
VLSVSGEPIPGLHESVNTQSPALSPDEAQDLAAASAGVDRGLAGLRRPPDLILGFFRHAGLEVNQLW